jgi:hypothetical protein
MSRRRKHESIETLMARCASWRNELHTNRLGLSGFAEEAIRHIEDEISVRRDANCEMVRLVRNADGSIRLEAA